MDQAAQKPPSLVPFTKIISFHCIVKKSVLVTFVEALTYNDILSLTYSWLNTMFLDESVQWQNGRMYKNSAQDWNLPE